MGQAAQTVADFLQVLTANAGLRLRFRVKVKTGPLSPETASIDAGREALRNLHVEFTGPDTPMLIARNGEVLNALEHVAAQILRLEPEQHDRLQFDADHFKANRQRQLREQAQAAVERVRVTGRPHSFPAMSSRERRELHLLLAESGLPTASSGEGPGRFVVLYPEGADTSIAYHQEAPPRRDASGVRKAFRPR